MISRAAQEILHQGENRSQAKTKIRNQRELEAEATAYVVMRHFGIEHRGIQLSRHLNDTGDQLRDSLETISGAAKRLIAAVETGIEDTEADHLAVVRFAGQARTMVCDSREEFFRDF